MNRVVHFEIQVDDIDRATQFYRNVFGWIIEDFHGGFDYRMVMTATEGSDEPGINGGLLKRQATLTGNVQGANAFVCTVQVDDFDDVEKKILDNGGSVALAKYPLTGMAWQGYYMDTEGNTFGIHQIDVYAK